ncbi:MAG: tetratricopeptide repeat protein [Flavobacterium sp. JAD_PAG50586_2]|nr:MAG: tetratricopeptide repeat protein [Flavobacterium sp. JAD_PAG50586_2]
MYRVITKISFLTLSLFCTLKATAQSDVDSLKAIIANPKLHDTTRLNNIALIIENLYQNNEADVYTNLMGSIARKNLAKKELSPILHKRYTMYLAAYYNNVSIQLEDKGDQRALDYLNKSINLYRSVEANDEVYTSIVSKGLLLSRRKRYREAIDCYFTALKYFEKNTEENVDGISYVYTNLGVLYGEQGQWHTAINYLKKSIDRINRKKPKLTVEDDLQKCLMYYNIGSAYITLKDYAQARINFNAALLLSKKHNQNSFSSFSLGKLGVIDLHFKRLAEAEKKLIKATEIAETGEAKGFTLAYLGDVYFEMKEYQKAQAVLKQALISLKLSRREDLKAKAYELLYKISKINGDYKEAVSMLELYNSIQDSTKTEEAKNELKQQQLEYDYEKKELNYRLESQKKTAAKNNMLIGLSSVVFLLLIGAYFLYRNYRQKQAISNFEKNELNQKMLLSQMNPHFIFNSIDNIQSLIYNKQDNDAINYLTKFSKLTRQILENSTENYITLSEELNMIDNYLTIQQLLYNNKFDFTLQVDETINAEMILIAPMLTQPFIENAIKHGLKNKSEKGLIKIHFKLEENRLFFEISDNGEGFSTNEKTGENKSLAMKITKERLRNMSNKSDFEIKTENIFDDNNLVSGAKVLFEIPYIYEN